MENFLKKADKKTLLGILGMISSIVVVWFDIYIAIAFLLASISLFRWAKNERMTQGKAPNQRKECSEN